MKPDKEYDVGVYIDDLGPVVEFAPVTAFNLRCANRVTEDGFHMYAPNDFLKRCIRDSEAIFRAKCATIERIIIRIPHTLMADARLQVESWTLSDGTPVEICPDQFYTIRVNLVRPFERRKPTKSETGNFGKTVESMSDSRYVVCACKEYLKRFVSREDQIRFCEELLKELKEGGKQ